MGGLSTTAPNGCSLLLGGSGGCRLLRRAQQGLIPSPCSSHCPDALISLVSLELPLLPRNTGRDKEFKAGFLLPGFWEQPRKSKQLSLHCQGFASVQTNSGKQELPVPEPSQAGTARDCQVPMQQVTQCRTTAIPQQGCQTPRNTPEQGITQVRAERETRDGK